MKRAFFTRDSLHHEARVFVYKYAHIILDFGLRSLVFGFRTLVLGLCS
jgi:hypothetical protein